MALKKKEQGFSPNILAVAILTAVVVLVYLQTVSFGFVWDDTGKNLLRNPLLQPPSLEHLAQFWIAPYQGMYIPVAYTLWAGVAQVSQWLTGEPFSAWVFHLANVLMHMGNVLLVYALLRRLSFRIAAATAGALLFAIHPVQVEAVAWVTEFRGLLATGFALGAIHLYLTAIDRDSAGGHLSFRLAALVLLGLGLLSKPTVAVIPLFAVVLVWSRYRVSPLVLLRDGAAGLLLATLALGITVFAQSKLPAGFDVYSPLWLRPLVWVDSIGFYIGKVLFPIGLAASYGHTPATVSIVAASVKGALLLILAAGLWFTRHRVRPVVAGFALFVIGFLPVSGLVPFAFQWWSTVADRYIYLSMIGVALVFAWSFERVSRLGRLPLTLLLLFWAGWSGALQAPTWSNALALWDHAVRVEPHNPAAYYNLSMFYGRHSRSEQALAYLNRYVEIIRNTPAQESCALRKGVAYYACVAANLGWEQQHRPARPVQFSRAYALLRAENGEAAADVLAQVTGNTDRQALAALAADAWGKAVARPILRTGPQR